MLKIDRLSYDVIQLEYKLLYWNISSYSYCFNTPSVSKLLCMNNKSKCRTLRSLYKGSIKA